MRNSNSSPTIIKSMQSFNRADQGDLGNEDLTISEFQKTQACGPKHTSFLWRGGRTQIDYDDLLVAIIMVG